MPILREAKEDFYRVLKGVISSFASGRESDKLEEWEKRPKRSRTIDLVGKMYARLANCGADGDNDPSGIVGAAPDLGRCNLRSTSAHSREANPLCSRKEG